VNLLFFFSCTPKISVSVDPKPIQSEATIEAKVQRAPTIQKSDIPIPEMPNGLPTWDDLTAPVDVFKPVPALALSFDYTKCYKEWFQGDSLPPNVRKHQGRVLSENEGSIGRLIQCPEARKESIMKALIPNPE
jgi:hypothetical protein